MLRDLIAHFFAPEKLEKLNGLFERAKQKFGAQDTSLRDSLTDALEDDAARDASLRGEELHMLRNLLGFKDVRVENVMVPRADIVAIDVALPLEEVTARFIGCAHSRLPLYRETLDDPIGMIHIKDLFALTAQNKAFESLESLRRDVLYAPPSMPALDLLLRMQTTHNHMAIVVDEYGGTDGLVTIEDLVEEIVGDIEDEHDEDDRPRLLPRATGVLEADARLPVAELENYLGVTLLAADEDFETVGGLVFALAGQVPQRGQVLTHVSGLEFEVRDVDARRIKTLRIRVVPSFEKKKNKTAPKTKAHGAVDID